MVKAVPIDNKLAVNFLEPSSDRPPTFVELDVDAYTTSSDGKHLSADNFGSPTCLFPKATAGVFCLSTDGMPVQKVCAYFTGVWPSSPAVYRAPVPRQRRVNALA